MITAIACNRTEIAKLLIEKGASVNKANKLMTNTPLMQAIVNRNKEMINYLINHGAEVNFPYTESEKTYPLFSSNNPITAAVIMKNVETAKVLLSRGANPNICNYAGGTPLSIALANKDNEMLKILLDHGADPNCTLGGKVQPAFLKAKDISTLKTLISYGADINASDFLGNNILHESNDIEITKYALEHGIDPNSKNSFGQTPLHTVSSPGIVEMLVKNGAELDLRDNSGNTPVMSIKEDNNRSGRSEIKTENPYISIKYLIENGADVTNLNDDKISLLHLICSTPLKDNENAGLIKLIAEKGADVNIQDLDGNTPLHEISKWAERPESMKSLLKYGANVNITDYDGQTPLHKCTDPEMALLLIEYGANVNARDLDQNTPLLIGCSKSLETIRILLSNNADINAKNSDNESLIFNLSDILTYSDSKEQKIKKLTLLKTLGLDLPMKNVDGQTAMFVTEDPDIIDFLISNGLNPNTKDIDGKTPLFFLNTKAVEKLKAAGADTSVKDLDGYTYIQANRNELRLRKNINELKEQDRNFKMADKIEKEFLSLPFMKVVNSGNVRQAENMLKKKPELANITIKVPKRIQNRRWLLGSGIKTPLNCALNNQDIKMAKLLIKYGANVNSKSKSLYEIPPLGEIIHLDSGRDMNEMAQILISKGAAITNYYNYYDQISNPLSEAISHNFNVLAKMMINSGINLNDGKLSPPPIHSAFANNNYDILEYLIKKGADINIKNKSGNDIAQNNRFCDENQLRYLLDNGWNINNKDSKGETILFRECPGMNISKVRFLISNGADVNSRNNKGQTPLFVVSSPSIAEVLIKAGADINTTDYSGKTPLFCAKNPIMYDFFKSQSTVNLSRDKEKSTSLHYACSNSNLSMIFYNVKCGSDVNAKDNLGRTPLHCIIQEGFCGFSAMGTELLLQNHANPNTMDKSGKTPLHYTIIENEEYKTKSLLRFGANPNIRDKSGNTPLHYAAMLKDKNFIDPRILLKAGADPNIKNNKGETPMDIARKSKSNRKGAFLRRLQMGIDNQAEKAKKNGI